MVLDNLNVIGSIDVKLYDGNMVLKTEFSRSNLVVHSGKEFIASRMTNSTESVISHMGVGGDSTPSTTTSLSLGIQAGDRVELLQIGGVATGNVITYSAVFGLGIGTGSLYEIGLFNASENGVMLSRATFPKLDKEIIDTLSVIWKITIL